MQVIFQIQFKHKVTTSNTLQYLIWRDDKHKVTTSHTLQYLIWRDDKHKVTTSHTSLVPRPFPPPVFDRLQYANTEGEGLGDLVTCGYVR